MAEEHRLNSGEKVGEEVRDRGLFDFLGKKKEQEHHEGAEGKCEEEVTVTEVDKVEGEGKSQQEEVLVAEFEKVQVTEAAVKEEEEKKEGLLEKLHRSHSTSSSSSSDEEDAADQGEGERKRKKKNLKDKIKEKISGEKKEDHEKVAAAVVVEDNTIPVEKIDELAPPESDPAQEKKSLLEKIKEKLPGGKKPAEEAAAASPAPVAEHYCADQGKEHHHEGDSPKEKKGFLGKIMDKIPGYHKGTGPEESGAAH